METFFKEMRGILSEAELNEFIASYDNPHFKGVRVNTLKCSEEKFLSLMKEGEKWEKTPFSPCGFYVDGSSDFSGNHPLHHSGAVYFQEPSAMSAVTLLSPKEGDFVLDLCAAPGGKSTQIAAELKGKGLIWSNEIVKNRANILLGNMERCGVKNTVVSSANPEFLCENLSGVFDKILVDAPCSGEGMFRRDENAFKEWSVEHTRSCALRQRKILDSAKLALRAGGELVYSTCTFAKEENEDVISDFLSDNPDFELVECNESFGRKGLGGIGTRIYPMDGGEGHFAAKLRKKGESGQSFGRAFSAAALTPKNKIPSLVTDFLKDVFKDTSGYENLLMLGDNVYALPDNCPEIKGNSVIRAGVFVGTVKKNFFEPAHALFMSADINNLNKVLDLPLSDSRLSAFLRGEEISAEGDFKGFTAVAAEGIITGFGKVSGGRLKNKYPKGLRTLN